MASMGTHIGTKAVLLSRVRTDKANLRRSSLLRQADNKDIPEGIDFNKTDK